MKKWKKIFLEIWGVKSMPLHLTKERAQLYGLIGSSGQALASRVSEADREPLMSQLQELMDINLSLYQQKWCLARLGIHLDGEESMAAKKTEEPLFERHAGKKNKPASQTSSSSSTTTPASTPASSSSSAFGPQPAHTKAAYVHDPDDSDYMWGENGWQGSASAPVTSHHSQSFYASDMEKRRMRKLPYRPGPHTFERWDFARTVIVGDLHGCADELLELLDYIQFKPGEDLLISCGDVVDRGPKISECFEILREYKAWIALGNHEEPFLKWLFFETHPDYRDKWGGKNNPIDLTYRQDQQDSLHQLKRQDWETMLKMQLALPLDWLAYNPCVVHAGLFPGNLRKPDEQDPFSIIRMINLDSTGQPLPFHSSGGQPWWDLYDKRPGPHHVIYGHSTTKDCARVRKYSTGLDGGAVYGGALTCLVIDGVSDGSGTIPQGQKGTHWNLYSVRARGAHYISSAAEISGGQNFTFGNVKK